MKDRVYLENEAQIIDPLTQMHYAHLSGYGNTVFPQSHDFYELMFALSGTQTLEINRSRIRIGKNTMVLIRPNEIHSRRYEQPGQHINVAFSAQIAAQMTDYLGEGFPAAQFESAPAPLCAMLSSGAANLYKRRFDELNLIPIHCPELTRTMLRILLLEIVTREFADGLFRDRAASQDWFLYVVDQMKEPEALARGVPEMVRLSGKSHEYLCRVCKRQLGMTPVQFVNDLRLTYAANRLRHSADSIIDVCYAAGFDNLSHFYHLFRRKYDLTPGDFRRAGEEG